MVDNSTAGAARRPTVPCEPRKRIELHQCPCGRIGSFDEFGGSTRDDAPTGSTTGHTYCRRPIKSQKPVALAYFQLGEIRFDDGNWRLAEQLYAASAKLDTAGTIPCTLYRKAWAQYRQGHPYLARQTFKKCEKSMEDPSRADRVRKACATDSDRLIPSAR